MNLAELQKEAHAIAKDHGWWDQERTFGDLIALVHSELSEALEAYREYGDCYAYQKWEIWPDATYDVTEIWCAHETPDQGNYKQKVIGLEGVPYELADVVIRVADMAEWYGYDLSIAEEKKPFDYFEPSVLTFGTWITMLHGWVADAFRHEGTEAVVEDCLATVVAGVQDMAAHYGIDLDAAIEAKLEYNRTRPYRHGGKAL